MTIDKDKLLILGVVAVLGFFLWKSRKDTEAKNAAAAASKMTEKPVFDTGNVNAIVKALGLTPTQESIVLKQAYWCVYSRNNGGEYGNTVSEKAATLGITFSQMAVLQGLYEIRKQLGSDYSTLVASVKAM